MEKNEVSPFPIEIGRVKKTKTEYIVVSVNEYQGKKFIDLRVHYIANAEADETLPTKKGLTLNRFSYEPTMRLLIEAFKKLQEVSGEESETKET